MKVIEIKPNRKHEEIKEEVSNEGFLVTSIFLAGTIDCGNSPDWQHDYVEKLKENVKKLPGILYVYNPRRDSGEGIQPGDIEEMNYQITWELEHMEKASKIYMRILGDSKSPISLLELGLWAGKDPTKIVVCCDPSYYRYQNIAVTCKKSSVMMIAELP